MESTAAYRSYRSAGGVVVAATDQVLVLVRAGRMGSDGRPEMRLPKGHIELGESPMEAALREVSEESGLVRLEVLADLGDQEVRFTWRGAHYLRDESYFLMTVPPGVEHGEPEAQFERRWLGWADALAHLTFEAEKEWVRRAQVTWSGLQNVSDKDTQQTNHHAQVQEKIAISKQE
jgi:8-oxo-dGTP pyrophosphatase MutT (NUDIX family)